MVFQLASTSFKPGEKIPSKYTCEEKNVSPPLHWENPTSKTKCFALLCEDPDAPVVWSHWVIYNIPSTASILEEDFPHVEKTANGTIQGRNSSKKIGYNGPCPPVGTHRYFFRLYALDTFLALPSDATKSQVEETIKDHILGKAELMGVYQKTRK